MPGEMFKLLRKSANDSIRNDFNMMIEEYGFWEKLSSRDQIMVVNELFTHVLDELEPLLFGCEQSFISQFVMSFAYRSFYAGEVV